MIEVGDIVRTNYGTGPYRVVTVARDCCCASYLDALDHMGKGKPPASPPHFHLVLVDADCPIGKEPPQRGTWRGYSWLNGFAEVGGRYLNVWRDDEIFVEGRTPGVQLNLFT